MGTARVKQEEEADTRMIAKGEETDRNNYKSSKKKLKKGTWKQREKSQTRPN